MKTYLTKFGGTLIAALILIALAGYLYFFELRKPDEGEKKEEVFPALNEGQISEIELIYPKHTVVSKKEGGNWFVFKDSKRFKADGEVISDMIENITQMKIEKVASQNPTDLAGFGLDNPQVEVIAKTTGKEYRTSVGGDSPVGSGKYIRVGNDDRILLVDKSSVGVFLNKSANDLRGKQILSLDESKVRKLGFKSGDSSFEVVRENGDWTGKDVPEYVEIDQARVWSILSNFLNLKVDNFEDDEPKNLSAYGLDRPSAEIEIFDGGEPARVLFGNKKESGDYYVKLGSEDPVYSISEFVFVQVPQNVNDIRVREIVELDTEEVNAVEIKRGDTRISITKGGSDWKLDGDENTKVDEAKVQELLEEINSLSVEEFVNDSPSDLSIYGLDKPDIEVTISEADKKITLLFVKRENEKVYVKLGDKNSVYALNSEILSSIPSSKDELTGN